MPSVRRSVHPKCLMRVVACEWTDHFLKIILLTALFGRARTSQNALVSWLRTHQVKISACVNVHASIYCSSKRVCSSWLWNPSTRGRFLLTILFAVIFVHFECTLTPPCPPIPTSRYNGIQKISVVHYGPLREIRWVTGKSNTAQAKEPATTAPPRHSERAFECASVFMITYWFFFLSCFLVKTNWTSHNDFFV